MAPVKILLVGALVVGFPLAAFPSQPQPRNGLLLHFGSSDALGLPAVDATPAVEEAPSTTTTKLAEVAANSISPTVQAPLKVAHTRSRTALRDANLGAASKPSDDWSTDIEAAARQFGIPSSWVRSVMQVESAGRQLLGGRPITSPAGAMGLMQLMPGTYAELRARYGLGPDPYDPHDNLLAGAAYLRELYDQFGAANFIAAYNAGPGRVGELLTHGRQLPDETRRYLAAIQRTPAGPAILPTSVGITGASKVQDLTGLPPLPGRSSTRRTAPQTPEEAPLFVASRARTSLHDSHADEALDDRPVRHPSRR